MVMNLTKSQIGYLIELGDLKNVFRLEDCIAQSFPDFSLIKKGILEKNGTANEYTIYFVELLRLFSKSSSYLTIQGLVIGFVNKDITVAIHHKEDETYELFFGSRKSVLSYLRMHPYIEAQYHGTSKEYMNSFVIQIEVYDGNQCLKNQIIVDKQSQIENEIDLIRWVFENNIARLDESYEEFLRGGLNE